jgi:chitinase
MKIIITESQYNKLTEKNLQKLCYSVWNKQKKMGEEPHLDDVIYDISGIRKESRDDYDKIRPIWYEYNGGFDNLVEKLKDEIDTKEYKLVEPEFNLETRMKVVHLDIAGEFVEIMVDVDPRGTIDFHGWDEETEEEYQVIDTIDAAYSEAQSNYETGDLMGMIRSSVYDFFYGLLEKYGIPIDVDIDLEEIY